MMTPTQRIAEIGARLRASPRALALDPIPEDMRSEFDFPIESWKLVEKHPLVLRVEGKDEQWTHRTWIVMNGPGLLAVDGDLSLGRRWI